MAKRGAEDSHFNSQLGISSCWFWVSSFAFWVWGFWVSHSDFGVRGSGFGKRGLDFRVSGANPTSKERGNLIPIGFSSFGFRISIYGFWH